MSNQRVLLVVDGVVNLILGSALLLAPAGLIEMFGLPAAGSYFYTTVLGAVLFGIGIALLLALRSLAGLGLVGAIAINLCGATGVAAWMLLSPGQVPLRGSIVLWAVIVVVYGIAAFELAVKPWLSGDRAG